MPFYLKIDFLRKSDPIAMDKGRLIKTLLASHPYCSGPGSSTPDILGSVIDRLQIAGDEAKCRDVNKIRARVEVRNEFNNTFRNTARAIETWANGDLTKLQLTGFDVRQFPKKGSTPGQLPAPILSVVQGLLEGTMVANMSAVKGAATFDLHVTTGDPSQEASWQLYDSYAYRTKILITGRTPGQSYWFRGRGFGVTGYGAWSKPVSLRSL
jgi:hypothetical protein